MDNILTHYSIVICCTKRGVELVIEIVISKMVPKKICNRRSSISSKNESKLVVNSAGQWKSNTLHLVFGGFVQCSR